MKLIEELNKIRENLIIADYGFEERIFSKEIGDDDCPVKISMREVEAGYTNVKEIDIADITIDRYNYLNIALDFLNNLIKVRKECRLDIGENTKYLANFWPNSGNFNFEFIVKSEKVVKALRIEKNKDVARIKFGDIEILDCLNREKMHIFIHRRLTPDGEPRKKVSKIEHITYYPDREATVLVAYSPKGKELSKEYGVDVSAYLEIYDNLLHELTNIINEIPISGLKESVKAYLGLYEVVENNNKNTYKRVKKV